MLFCMRQTFLSAASMLLTKHSSISDQIFQTAPQQITEYITVQWQNTGSAIVFAQLAPLCTTCQLVESKGKTLGWECPGYAHHHTAL